MTARQLADGCHQGTTASPQNARNWFGKNSKVFFGNAQASIADDYPGRSRSEIDIDADLVDHARKSVAELTLGRGAEPEFANLARSPQPQKLREDVEKQAAESPLSSIIPMTIHDA